MGKNTMGNLAKQMAVKANLTSSRIINHSARKTAIQTLLHADVPPGSVMQLSGHKNIQSLNTYSTLSTDQQRDLSNILADRTNFSNASGDRQNPEFGHQSHPAPSSSTDFMDDDDLISLICAQPNCLDLQELQPAATGPPASYNVSVSNNQSTQPPPTRPEQFSFLNGTIHGKVTININHNAELAAAKRRRVIMDSDSEE